MRITDVSDLWWKNAVIYCLDVGTYMDWDGDGSGDFDGLAHRIDYLAELGVTCLWLMPFYPTPDRDDGYDITDYFAIDPKLGHLGDLVEVILAAKDRGMRVIADLVVNHTSDKHPWFRSARASRNSPYRDFYVWSDEIPDDAPETIFPGQEDGVWSWDEKAGQYFLHRFYHHQPDLNIANPEVRDEVGKVVGFWLELGLSGFRVDAVPYILEGYDPSPHEPGGNPHDFLRELRGLVNRRRGDAMLLGEVNMPYAKQLDYFGGEDGNELTMQFDFEGNQRIALSLARRDARPLARMLAKRPELPRIAQWANFLRNHDELTLDKLTELQREEVFAEFAPDENMRAFGRGIVRRMPTMLGGDEDRIRMAYSLMFSLPGTPVLFYGEELGMGENLEMDGRLAVRTPMQWSSEKNGGFSPAPPSRLSAKVVEGEYGPERINVDQQRTDPDSMLSFMQTLIRRYRASPEIGFGELSILDQPHNAVLVHRATGELGSMIAMHNFDRHPLTVEVRVDDADESTRFVDLLHGEVFAADADGRLEVELGRYGHRWLRMLPEGSRRLT